MCCFDATGGFRLKPGALQSAPDNAISSCVGGEVGFGDVILCVFPKPAWFFSRGGLSTTANAREQARHLILESLLASPPVRALSGGLQPQGLPARSTRKILKALF